MTALGDRTELKALCAQIAEKRDVIAKESEAFAIGVLLPLEEELIGAFKSLMPILGECVQSGTELTMGQQLYDSLSDFEVPPPDVGDKFRIHELEVDLSENLSAYLSIKSANGDRYLYRTYTHFEFAAILSECLNEEDKGEG